MNGKSTMNDDVILSVEGLVKRYGEFTAVNGVSFTVKRGETFGLLGPNGAGKSTLIGMLTGVLTPSAGTATVGGYNLQIQTPAVKKIVGLVPQELALYQELTAQENLHFFGQMYGLRGAYLQERIEYCLSVAQLHEWRDKDVATFSGGMKRRLNLGIGLLHEPKILFLDEPTVGVDPQSRNHIFSSVKQLVEAGLSVIYTTHYMEEAENLCQRVAIYDKGKIITIDTPQNLIRSVENNFMEIGVDNPPAELVFSLSLLAGVQKVSIRENQLLITCDTLQQVAGRVLDCIQKSGHIIRSLQTPKSNLETVFLNLTGRTLRD